jgi:hypothetical protein
MTPTRLTPEREKEIMEYPDGTYCGGLVKDSVREIDALRAQRDRAIAAGEKLLEQLDALKAECERLRTRKDDAYLERNKCVVLIVKMALALGLKAGVAQHDPNDKEWEDDWRTVVYIDLPSGQISWHFHDSQKNLLGRLPLYEGLWDGHSTELKYERVLNPGSLAQEDSGEEK